MQLDAWQLLNVPPMNTIFSISPRPHQETKQPNVSHVQLDISHADLLMKLSMVISRP